MAAFRPGDDMFDVAAYYRMWYGGYGDDYDGII